MNRSKAADAPPVDEHDGRPLAAVLVARKEKTVWHISLGHIVRLSQKRVVVEGAMRIKSASSNKELTESMVSEAQRLNCLAVLYDASCRGSRRYVAHCPQHGELGRNTSEEYAAERLLFHHESAHGAVE